MYVKRYSNSGLQVHKMARGPVLPWEVDEGPTITRTGRGGASTAHRPGVWTASREQAWLQKQDGRSWMDVKADLIEKLDRDQSLRTEGVRVLALRRVVADIPVETCEGGEVVCHGRPFPLEKTALWSQVYIDRNGIVRSLRLAREERGQQERAEREQRRAKAKRAKPQWLRVAGKEMAVLEDSAGNWYELILTPLRPPVRRWIPAVMHEGRMLSPGFMAVSGVFRCKLSGRAYSEEYWTKPHKELSESEALALHRGLCEREETLGRRVAAVCSGRRQLGKKELKELKKHGLIG